MQLSNALYSIATSDAGNVYVSIDNGINWNISVVPNAVSLYGIAIGLNGNAFAVGYNSKVFISSNASNYNVWFEISPSFVSMFPLLSAVSSVDGINCIAVGYNKTVLLGQLHNTSYCSWQQVKLNIVDNIDIYSISQINRNTAMIVGSSNFAARTLDGGVTWLRMNVFLLTSTTVHTGYPPHTVQMLNTKVAYMASYSVEICATKNGGSSWYSLTDIAITNSRSIFSINMYSLVIRFQWDCICVESFTKL
jgi:photosystem II stability/assembly factor-like uncharacterized protein